MSRRGAPQRLTSYAALLAVLLLAAAACGGADNGPDAADDPAAVLLDGDWTLDHATGLGLDDAHPITLSIDGDRLSGGSACNRFLGSLRLSGDLITVGALGGTEMACRPPSVMRLERDFLAALQSAQTARVTGDTLILTGPDATLRFLSTAPARDAASAGTDVGDDDASVTGPAGTEGSGRGLVHRRA